MAFALLPLARRCTRLTYRIHRSAAADRVVFALSGELTEDCAVELCSVVLASGEGKPVIIDLRDVTLVDVATVKCLARAEAAGVTLVNCPDYVRRWITAEAHRSDVGENG